MNVKRTITLAFGAAACSAALGIFTATVQSQVGSPGNGEWRDYGGDKGYTKYSPLTQIDPSNVSRLQVAWRRPAVAPEFREKYPNVGAANNNRSTPLMVGGVLYASNGIGLIEAFDPGTGKTIWIQENEGPVRGGASNRGIALWGSGADARLLTLQGQYLVAIELKTGKVVRSFGTDGRVDLLPALGPAATNFSWNSPPQVCNNVVLIGAAQTDSPRNKEEVPGKVQAFDVRTGKPVWAFNPIPRPGEVGNDTWEADSWSYSGQGNVWSMMSSDEKLGLAYLPTGAPTNDMYGGHRLGDNLFANTLVAVECATGKRVWHFQTVHHDLWDYDNNVAPILIDITVSGKPVRAVVQLSKQAMAYVLDRATGRPVWPIEERPVPRSSTPGERTAATQPFPTKPLPFDRHGLLTDDLIDFTPQLRTEALAIAKKYVLGPIFTPPSVKTADPTSTQGTLQMPGSIGGAEWGGAPFDPETHIMYVPSITGTFAADLLAGDPKRTNLRYTRGSRELIDGPQGLPLTKPPYGRITAINMNTGDHLWMVPNGAGPRDHPALKGLNLPELGQPSRDMPILTKTLLFLMQGDPLMIRTPAMGTPLANELRAYDKSNGKVLWKMALPAGATGAPMTYMHGGKQYLVVPIGSRTHPGEFVALALP